jgi:predicted phage terminase large subunit-like protein
MASNSAPLTNRDIAERIYRLPPRDRALALRYLRDWRRAPLADSEDGATAEAPKQRETFAAYINRVAPWFIWYRHARRWVRILQRVADGEINRLLWGAPPRHIKSTLFQLFAGYYLDLHPDHWVGTTSYGAKIAIKNSKKSRDFFRAAGSAVGETDKVDEWHTAAGGGMWAAGMGGSLIGWGYHLGIIDDPVKNLKEASSRTIQERNWDFYTGSFWNRKEPGNIIIVTHQRWPGEADLIGRILAQEAESEKPECWHVLLDEAIKEGTLPDDIPDTCTLLTDEGERQPGEALCPERYPIKELEKDKERMGDFLFAAQFQQRPKHKEGSLFKWNDFEVIDQAPRDVDVIGYWDTAGTEGGGNDTAGVLLGRTPKGVYVFIDCVAEQWGPSRRNANLRDTAIRWRNGGWRPDIWFERITGQSGKDDTADVIRSLEGFPAFASEEASTGSKLVRARPLAAAVAAGNVKLVRGAWNTKFRNQLCNFRGLSTDADDIVDAASGAYNKLAERAGRVWRTSHVSH